MSKKIAKIIAYIYVYLKIESCYERRFKRAKRNLELRKISSDIRKLNNEYKHKASVPTAKLFAVFLFVNFTIVEVYSMWAMIYLRDLSSLSTLITTVIGQVITYWIYSRKSTVENSCGGITYDLAMQNLQNQLINNQVNTTKSCYDDEDAVG